MIERGQAILVTGATGAIGFEIAAQAAEAGAIVGVHGSREESVAAAIERLLARVPDARLVAVPGDFHQPGIPKAIVAHMVQQAGRLDALVHCAITGAPGTTGAFADTDPDQFGPLAANVVGTVQQLAHAALPALADGCGTFIAFAADSGRFAAPRQSIMAGAYAAIMSFVRNLALEAARDGVRVHCIAPTFVEDTPIFEAFGKGGRGDAARARAGLGLPTPRDIAPVVLFLCGPGAAKITGQVISVNGGLNA